MRALHATVGTTLTEEIHCVVDGEPSFLCLLWILWRRYGRWCLAIPNLILTITKHRGFSAFGLFLLSALLTMMYVKRLGEMLEFCWEQSGCKSLQSCSKEVSLFYLWWQIMDDLKQAKWTLGAWYSNTPTPTHLDDFQHVSKKRVRSVEYANSRSLFAKHRPCHTSFLTETLLHFVQWILKSALYILHRETWHFVFFGIITCRETQRLMCKR